MSRVSLLLLAALLFRCGEAPVDAPPPVRTSTVRDAAPPPPPPPPRDPEGKGPAPVPAAIASFLGTAGDVEVLVEGRALPPELARETAAVLASPRSYTDNHYLCTDPGIRLGLRRGGRQLDLIVGLTCRHVHDGTSREEIGFLSESGEEFFVRLARRVR